MDSTNPGHCGVVGQCVRGSESFTKTLEDLLVRWEAISFLRTLLHGITLFARLISAPAYFAHPNF